MAQENIRVFNEYAAKLFVILYDRFPKVEDVFSNDIVEEDSDETREYFYGTLRFLGSEGFISYTKAMTAQFKSVCLTAKGLAILDAIPDCIESDKETFIQKVRGALKDGANETIKSTIQQVISYSISSFMSGG